MRRRVPVLLTSAAAALLAAAVVGGPAEARSASTADPLAAQPRVHATIARLAANESSNWFGYNQGTVEKGGKLFNQISGDWTVPTARQHTKGQDAYSSTWVGIGGGCVDAGCLVGDNTLIQTGTEQDVDASGHASYSAWWELIPAPSITITNLPVAPGDHFHADIREIVADSNVWTITLTNVSKGKTFTQTVPYTSTHATAEWIEETPLLIGTNAGFSALPTLSTTRFELAKTNGANAALTTAEKMLLVDGNGKVIGTPSSPDPDHDGFNECAWATSCSAPTSG